MRADWKNALLSPGLKRGLSAMLGLLIFAILALDAIACADGDTTHDLQAWQISAIRGHITDRLLDYLDVQNNEVDLTSKPGAFNGKNHEGQLLIRPALGYQLNKYLSVWQGVGWTPAYQPQFRNERQMWEQVILEKNFKYFKLSNRTRLEIRRIEDADGTALRLRDQLRVAVPLGKTKWSIVAYDEPFVNLNSVGNGPQAGVSQNWLFLGINRKFNNHLNMEVGYLNNFVNNISPAGDRMNHVIMASFNVMTNEHGFFHKKELR